MSVTSLSKALVVAGENATLLIHEATFETCKVDHAIQKRHSTTDEAIEIGQFNI